jgi:hypothetical protein
MAISGALGLFFFIVANFTHVLLSLNILAGWIQIAINVLVFVTWLKGLRTATTPWQRFVAAWGVAVPVVLTGITLFRVLIPALSA